jgi:hypothetical protein
MAGLVPASHDLTSTYGNPWMPAPKPGMTQQVRVLRQSQPHRGGGNFSKAGTPSGNWWKGCASDV